MSEHKDVRKFLQSPPGCYSNIVSFKALGVHFQHQMVRRFQLLSFKKTVFICRQQIKAGAWCECPLFPLQITSAIRSDVPSQIYCPKSPSSCWQIQYIYLDEPLKHVSQRQEGNEAVILIWENNFLQESYLRNRSKRWVSNKNKKGKSNAATVCRGSHVCHFEKSWEVSNHVSMCEHDSLRVPCVKTKITFRSTTKTCTRAIKEYDGIFIDTI